MINETILYLPHTGCGNSPLNKYAKELGANPAWDPDIRVGEPLKKIFSRVLRYDFGIGYAKHGIGRTNNEIIDLVCKERPKYVFWPSMSYEILESTFQTIRKEGTYVIAWFFDDEVRFDGYSKWWVPYVDYILTTDEQSVTRYHEIGANAMKLLVTSNPEVFRLLPGTKKRYDVSFVGTIYADRNDLESLLLESRIQIEMFGRGSIHGYVSVDEMVGIYNATKINLCFVKSYAINTRPQMKSKIFDICMCGGFLLCEYIAGIEEYFEIDKEIVCFIDINEAIDKIEYYLHHEAERDAIARAGWRRAQNEHGQTTWMLRVFEEIEKDSKPDKWRAADNSLQLNMPPQIRHLPSSYHLRWARALMIEKFPDKRWQEELDLALFYNPENKDALRWQLIRRLPAFLRRILLYCRPAYIKLKQLLRSYLASSLMLGK